MNWRFDVENAPKGDWVESKKAGKGGKEIISRRFVPVRLWVALEGPNGPTAGVTTWLEDKQRWNGFNKGKTFDAFIVLPENPSLTENRKGRD